MATQKFKTSFNRDCTDLGRVRTFDTNKYPNKVVKSLAVHTDINAMMAAYSRGSTLPLNGREPIYDENFIKIDNLIEAKQVMNRASDYFNGLPSEIRAHYGNDLMTFAKAVTYGDPKLSDLGILPKPLSTETSLEAPAAPTTSSNDVKVETPSAVQEGTVMPQQTASP